MRITKSTSKLAAGSHGGQIPPNPLHSTTSGDLRPKVRTDDPHPRSTYGRCTPPTVRLLRPSRWMSSCARSAPAARRTNARVRQADRLRFQRASYDDDVDFIVRHRRSAESRTRAEPSRRWPASSATGSTRHDGPRPGWHRPDGRGDVQTLTSKTSSIKLDRELIALTPVKTRSGRLSRRCSSSPACAARPAFTAGRPTCACSFTGNPRTARRPWRCGWPTLHPRILERDEVVAGTPAMTWSASTSGTRHRSQGGAQTAYGGVLFIDEAYYLYRPENGATTA